MKYNKYKNKKTIRNGRTFDSIKEADRAGELELLQLAGHITGLEYQPEFEICPRVKWNGKTLRVRKYRADFAYIDAKSGMKTVEDVKSDITKKIPVYTLKRQLFLSQYPDYRFIET